MTIVRSVGISTLVALMSAHRIAAETAGGSVDQATFEVIDAYLRCLSEHHPYRDEATEPPRSYS